MCGIFGIFINKNVNLSQNHFLKLTKDLAILSETRGKEASGFALLNKAESCIDVFKSMATVSSSLSDVYLNRRLKDLYNNNTTSEKVTQPFGFTGHTRLVTNGSQLEIGNNQPVVKDCAVGIHNGIIVNDSQLWKDHSSLKREFEVDSEILFSLITKYISENNSTEVSVKKTLDSVSGTVASAVLFNNLNTLILTTNNGSLYTLTDKNGYLIFASEKYILDELQQKNDILTGCTPEQILPYNLVSLDTDSFDISTLNLKNGISKVSNTNLNNTKLSVNINSISGKGKSNGEQKYWHINNGANHKLLEYNSKAISNLKRCTKCLLPETFPFISFDSKGLCNVCNNYTRKITPKGHDQLVEDIRKYKNNNGSINCIIPYSGGRDSSYSVHYVKKELGLNPITYTYDWGMVTDLARRNIARVCSKLGIENIIVSADIAEKRKNIQKNILAWLKKPDLGMVPLFMAGDKQFHYYLAQVKKQNNIDLSFWGTNYLENTDFKLGFCGIDFDFTKERISSLKQSNKIKLSAFYLKNYLTNPAYINSSIIDTLKSFASRYMSKKKDYLFIYDYIKWDEKHMEDILINQYDWETSADTRSTWRIGDGTASFYNYIYYTVAGFSEFDTFRSNQIREGLITRDEAMDLINEENQPRFDSLIWYLNTVGLEFEPTIKRINSIPKLYPL